MSLCITFKHNTYCRENEPTWVDWCGISVWTSKKKTDTFRNWIFGQNLDVFGERVEGKRVSIHNA
jgi:pullulanase/glycogen debranching enzyme